MNQTKTKTLTRIYVKKQKLRKDNNENNQKNFPEDIPEAEDNSSRSQRDSPKHLSTNFEDECEKQMEECKMTIDLDLYQEHHLLIKKMPFFQKYEHPYDTLYLCKP